MSWKPFKPPMNPNIPWKVQPYTKYCKKCGRPLLPMATNEDGTVNYHVDFEQEVGMHYDCYQKAMVEMKPKLDELKKEVELAQEVAKKAADEKYEEAIAKYMEELSKRNGNNAPTDT